MIPKWIDLYIALACGWLCIETNLTLKMLEQDKQHWLNRSLTKTRRYAKAQGATMSVVLRVGAAFALTFGAWIPVLIAALVWPFSVFLYVSSTLNNKD